jgi:hypothetical protein
VRLKPAKITGGMALYGDRCEDVVACTARRLTPPQTYTEAHAIVLAARRAALR